MKKALLFLFLLIPSLLSAEEIPPYDVKDPAITENFRNIYYAVDQLTSSVTAGGFATLSGTQTFTGNNIFLNPRNAFGVNAVTGYIGTRFTSVFTSNGVGGFVAGIDVDPTLTTHANDTNYATYLNVAGFGITTNANTSVVSSFRVAEPQITEAAGTVTTAASIYVENAPTEGAVNGAIITNDGDNIFNKSSGDTYTVSYTNYSSLSTVTGFVTPTKVIHYRKLGKLVHVWFTIDGTSNATTLTFTLPFASDNSVDVYGCAFTSDNGTYTTGGGLIQLLKNTSTVKVFKDMAANAFTNSGVKVANGQFFYQSQ